MVTAGHQYEHPNTLTLQYGSDGKCVFCVFFYNIILKHVSSIQRGHSGVFVTLFGNIIFLKITLNTI